MSSLISDTEERVRMMYGREKMNIAVIPNDGYFCFLDSQKVLHCTTEWFYKWVFSLPDVSLEDKIDLSIEFAKEKIGECVVFKMRGAYERIESLIAIFEFKNRENWGKGQFAIATSNESLLTRVVRADMIDKEVKKTWEEYRNKFGG